MNTYLLCLRKNELRGLQAENTIFNTAEPFGLTKQNCESFCDVRSFFQRLSQLIENESLIILAVDTELYLHSKKLLCSALDLECAVNSDILYLLESHRDDKDDQCSVPLDSKVFLTKDGLFSGFAFDRDKDKIIFIPLENTRTAQCTGEPFVEYLKKVKNNSQPDENSDTLLTTSMNAVSENVYSTCQFLNDMGCKAVLSVSPTAKKLCRLLPEMNEITFSPTVSERNNTSPKDYAAVLAKEAAERHGVKIGASITNVFKVQNDEEDKFFIYVAVADREAARVKKLFAQPGESATALTASAIDTALDMIKGQAVRGKTILTDEDKGKQAKTPAIPIGKYNQKKILFTTIASSAAALFLCFAVAVGAVIFKSDDILVTSNPEISKSESNKDKNSDNSSGSFWDFLLPSPSDDEEKEENNGNNSGRQDNNENDGNSLSGPSSSGGENNSDEPGSGDIDTSDEHTTSSGSSEPDASESGTEGNTETTDKPTEGPTDEPTEKPTEKPTETEPTEKPTEEPSETEPTEPTQPTEPSTEANTEPITQPVTETPSVVA